MRSSELRPTARSTPEHYPELMGKVLDIVTRTISIHLTLLAGFTKREAPTGAVTLIQRFGSALNQEKLDNHLNEI